MASKEQVLKLHAKYPQWTSVEIANRLGCSGGYVRATFERNGLNLGKKRRRRKIIVVKPAVVETAPPKPPAPPPRPPKPIPLDLPALRCVEIEPRHVSLIDLDPGDCRWPYGDGPFTFCGHPAVFGSYCGPHYGLSVGGGTLRANRKSSFTQSRLTGGWNGKDEEKRWSPDRRAKLHTHR